MNAPKSGPIFSFLERIVPRLKYPQLFTIVLGLFLIDLFVPDPVPFVDEALLGVLTLLLGTWKTRHEPPAEPMLLIFMILKQLR